MARWLYALLVFVPAAFVAAIVKLPPLAVFVLSAAGLVPLASIVGRATDVLGQHVGPRLGGLLNVSFANVAELIIAIFAIRHGLLTLVKASLTGSILSDTLLVLGLALVIGGLKNGPQTFNARATSTATAMMILAVAGLYLPATFALTVQTNATLEALSLAVAAVLLLTYIAYTAYTLLARKEKQRTSEQADNATGSSALYNEQKSHPAHGGWSVRRALLMLAGSVILLAILSEILANAVEPVSRQIGWTQLFVGVIIVPTIGNAAEHVTAAGMAWRDRIETSFAVVTSGSTQIALFVAPVLVFASVLLGHPLNLIFDPLELMILGLAVAIFAYINIDGRTNWLEGIQLSALYVLAAVAFFLLPPGH